MHNLIGWMLLGEGAGLAILSLASAYAVVGIATHPGTLPAPQLVGLLAEWIFVPVVVGLAYIFFLFPSGKLPSSRWRPVATLGLIATALPLAGFLVRPRRVALPTPGGISLTFQNPLGVKSLGPVLSTVLLGTLDGLALLVAVPMAAAIVSLVVRYRAGDRELRQQIKWLAFAAAAFFACQLAAMALGGPPWPYVMALGGLLWPIQWPRWPTVAPRVVAHRGPSDGGLPCLDRRRSRGSCS